MKKTNSTKPSAAKNPPFKTHMNSEHDYSMPMETANSSNKRDRMLTTPANTPEKSHTENKAKGTLQEHDSNTSTDTILKANDALGKRVDDHV